MNAAGARCEVVVTRSGALAMHDRSVGEVMHPIVGPRIEAEQLYLAPSRLQARLQRAAESPFVLLDVGLGAGSNAIAAWKVSECLPRVRAAPRDRQLRARPGSDHARFV